MASTLDEEAQFIRKLRKKVVEIDELARYIEPEDVIVRKTLEAALEEEFSGLRIILTDQITNEDPHADGISGLLYFGVFLHVLINDESQGNTGAEPPNLVGELDSRRPSLSIIDGIIRDAFDLETLDDFVYDLSIGTSAPIDIAEPLHAVGRSYPITAIKEVSR